MIKLQILEKYVLLFFRRSQHQEQCQDISRLTIEVL